MKSKKNLNRVAIIGCKNFSAANLHSLLMNGTVDELVLIEEDCRKLLQELSDLREAIPLPFPVRVFSGEFKDVKKAKIAVIASGVKRNHGESPVNLLRRNIEIIGRHAEKLKENDFDGVILVTTTPVDVLSNVVLEKSGLPTNKVIGSGKPLDTKLFRKVLNCDPFFIEINADDKIVAKWCAAISDTATFRDYCQPNCSEFGKMIEADKKKPVQIKYGKDPSLFAVGSCVARICEAILRDERTILPVSAMTSGQYGIRGVYMNMPCIIRRDGVEDIIKLKITPDEKSELIETSEIVKRTYDKLNKKKKVSLSKIF